MIAPVVGSGVCPAWIHTVEKRASSGSFMVMGVSRSPCSPTRASSAQRIQLSCDPLRMGSPRLPDEPSAARRRQLVPSLPLPPEAADPFSARELLLGSWPGRFFLGATALKLVIALWRRLGTVPGFVMVLSSITTVGLLGAVGYLAWRLFVRVQRH